MIRLRMRSIVLPALGGPILVSLAVLAGAGAAYAQSGGVPKNLDIFLLIGQSNMSGRGNMIASDSTTDIPGTWLFKDSATWEPARNPLNRYSTLEFGSAANQVGPGFGFATELHRLLPAKQFGLIVNARGGSAIASWVKPGKYYSDMLTRSRQAVKSGALKGILWHQGESDAADTLYLDKLKGLMDSLRRDLGLPDLPVVAGQIGRFEAKHADFNARILKLPERLARSAVVTSDSLLDKGDKLHFDRPGQIKLGQRYAEKIRALVYPGTATAESPPRPSADPGKPGHPAAPDGDGGASRHVGPSPLWRIDPAGKAYDSMGRSPTP